MWGTWSGESAAFFAFAALMLGGAGVMLSLKRIVHMVLAMAAVFLGLAGMFVLLEAEFVALVQVLIYAGAVSILMVFGIMMTGRKALEQAPPRRLHEAASGGVALLLFAVLFYAIRSTELPEPGGRPAAADNTLAIGQQLYTAHVIAFELISVLLTVAFIGAIVIARKEA
ncbi:NADH-quinone oxidoreductase subunit J [Paenibacillus sp. IB182496]|uniref:NADH-quinone oxidoreductase subunit J n=1 Tax=Paenibacillus sabuli TaxID=2772509 RepID=A0A927BSB7_9BACL|nr:NADH-quinone oxidoreductase subunit J [Paenibacillus sabuli]MBD2845877.1 NADH-quinone oxidoreductase subunit J [Paenibacillus sabuli]